MAQVKGIAFTISIIILTSLVIFLSLTISILKDKNSDRLAILLTHDQMFDVSTSLEESVMDLFWQSGISLTSSTVAETIPNPNASSFIATMNEFVQFVDGKVIVSDMVQTMPIRIGYATYSHSLYGGNDAVLTFEVMDKIDLDITLRDNITSCGWATYPGDVSLTITVTGEDGNECTDDLLLDRSLHNELSIDGRYVVALNSSGLFMVNSYTAPFDIALSVTQNDTSIILPAVISLNYSDFGVHRVSDIKI